MDAIALITDAFSRLPDMDFQANDDGTYTILDIPMKGYSDPIDDVRDLAFFARQFLVQDGIGQDIRLALRAVSHGGAAEVSSRPVHERNA